MEREIRYNPASLKFDLILDGEVIGHAWNYADGERTLDAIEAEIEAELARLASTEPVPVLALVA